MSSSRLRAARAGALRVAGGGRRTPIGAWVLPGLEPRHPLSHPLPRLSGALRRGRAQPGRAKFTRGQGSLQPLGTFFALFFL